MQVSRSILALSLLALGGTIVWPSNMERGLGPGQVRTESSKMVVSTLLHGERPAVSGVFTLSCLSHSIATVPIVKKGV